LSSDTRDRPSAVSDELEGSAVAAVAVSMCVLVAALWEDMKGVAVEAGGRTEETMR